MPGTAFTCPECGASARSARDIAAGSLVKCPGCSHVFRFGEEAVTAAEAAPAVRRSDPDDDRDRERPRRDDDYDDDRPRRRDERVRARRDDDDDDRPRRRRYEDEDDDRPRRRRKKGGGVTALIFVAVFVLMLVGVVGGVLAFVYNSTGSKDVVFKNPLPPPGAGGGGRVGGGFVGEHGFGENFVTTGLNNSPDEGNDKGKITENAAGALNDPALTPERPRHLVGPPPVAPKASIKGSDMQPDILAKAKNATTMMFFKNGPHAGSGSGFFVGPDLVMTNAHVVGMLAPGTHKPEILDVVLNSGMPNEAKCTGTVMGVDRGNDLALVKVGKPDKKDVKFPEPMSIAASSTLVETQQLWVLGFPHGESLGKRITVAPARVSSFRTHASGMRVQVHGGMEHGNSGGPVVDVAGQVVGVSVAKVENTEINFAVATEHVIDLLTGHLATLATGSPARKGDGFTLNVTVQVHDPLKKIKTATLEWWWGEPTMKVPATRGKAPEVAGATRQKVALKRGDKDQYSAAVELGSELPKGKVLWLQASQPGEGDASVYYEGVMVEVLGAPESRPVKIAFQPRRADGTLAVRATSTQSFESPEAGVHTIETNAVALMKEHRLGRDDQNNWAFGSDFDKDKFEFHVTVDGNPQDRSLSLQDHEKYVGKTKLELQYNDAGKLIGARPEVDGTAPEAAKNMLGNFAGRVARAIELVSVPCEKDELTPGHQWESKRTVPLHSLMSVALGPLPPGAAMDAQISMRYTYMGVQKVNGREFAAITVSGDVGDRFGEVESGTAGKVRGHVLVDVKTGAVAKANVVLDVTMKGQHLHNEEGDLVTTFEVKLQRE
jgi:hypothetical protein